MKVFWMHRKIIFSMIVVISAAIFILAALKVRANQTDKYGQLVISELIDLKDGEHYVAQKFQNGLNIEWLLTKSDLAHVYRLRLAGFDDSVATCSRPEFHLSSRNFLCLKGYVGAHSENRVFVDLENFTTVRFVDAENANNFLVSDAPNFIFDPYKPQNIAADMRNYDKNPLTDSIRSHYKWDGEKFIFDKNEMITYDEDYKLIQGEI